MKTERRIALWVGVLYIIGTVAGVLSVVSAGSPLLGADDYLKKPFEIHDMLAKVRRYSDQLVK